MEKTKQFQYKPGQYKITEFLKGDVNYLYIKQNGTFLVIEKEEGNYNVGYHKRLPALIVMAVNVGTIEAISWDEFYEQYTKALGQFDDFMGTRGVLIKPNQINRKVDVDEYGRLHLKWR